MALDNTIRKPISSTAASSFQDRPVRHLNQIDLSRRWKLSPRTLERWRWLRQGPRYVKVGGRVIYRLEDVETYEAEHLCQPDRSSQPPFKRNA
jgi:hypothetical protein